MKQYTRFNRRLFLGCNTVNVVHGKMRKMHWARRKQILRDYDNWFYPEYHLVVGASEQKFREEDCTL